MSSDGLPTDRPWIRGADSNTLLRLYDEARQAIDRAGTQTERQRADRAARRITQELRRRYVAV